MCRQTGSEVCAKEVYCNSFWERNQPCVERSENTMTSLSLFCFSLFQPQVARLLHTTHHLFLRGLGLVLHATHVGWLCLMEPVAVCSACLWVLWRVKQFTQAALLLTLLFHADFSRGQSPSIYLMERKFRHFITLLGSFAGVYFYFIFFEQTKAHVESRMFDSRHGFRQHCLFLFVLAEPGTSAGWQFLWADAHCYGSMSLDMSCQVWQH